MNETSRFLYSLLTMMASNKNHPRTLPRHSEQRNFNEIPTWVRRNQFSPARVRVHRNFNSWSFVRFLTLAGENWFLLLFCDLQFFLDTTCSLFSLIPGCQFSGRLPTVVLVDRAWENKLWKLDLILWLDYHLWPSARAGVNWNLARLMSTSFCELRISKNTVLHPCMRMPSSISLS